jgi:hypothetical protein
MRVERFARHLLPGAALLLALAVPASAQTVIVRKAPPGSTVEVLVNTAPAGSATVNESGDAVVPLKMLGDPDKPTTDAYFFVDVCGEARRVVIVERAGQTPPATANCERHELPGLFVVRRNSSLVFDVSGVNPTVLLRQGRYSLKPPRVWRPAPVGLVVSGGGGIGKFRDASFVACGDLQGCSGDDSARALQAGATYWFAKWLGAEISYLKPNEVSATADTDTFDFTTTFDAELVTISAKPAVPIGPSRIYGLIGFSWHRALLSTVQTSGSITDTFEMQTEGWSWSWGGGFELWLASSFGLYAEGGNIAIKGEAVNQAEGLVNDRFSYAVGGVRVRIPIGRR